LGRQSLALITPERLPEEPQVDCALRLARSEGGPTAIIMDSLRVARHLRRLVAAVGISVPQDVSIAAFGDGKVSLTGDVTYTELDNVAFGRRALDMLFDEELLEAPRHELFPVTLVKDKTTGPPPAT
jgi:DNA-binding LacI/PurR family transcriptional regulator